MGLGYPQEADSAVIRRSGGSWVGSGVSEALGAFGATPATLYNLGTTMTGQCDSVGAVCNLCRTKVSRPWVLLPLGRHLSFSSSRAFFKSP